MSKIKLDRVVAIIGKPGLYELLSENKRNFILRQLDNQKKFSLPMTKRLVHLSSQTIYKKNGNMTIIDVLKIIYTKENKQECILPKDDKEIKDYFLSLVKDYDEQKVYVSVIKKIIRWYNILQENNILMFEDKQEDKQEDKEKEKVDQKQDNKTENSTEQDHNPPKITKTQEPNKDDKSIKNDNDKSKP